MSAADAYFDRVGQWQDELKFLRTITTALLTEELKWNSPCYTYQNKNVVLLASFKEYCAVSFLKGVLLADTEKLLEAPGENSNSVRLFKFTDLESIKKQKDTIRNYINEAILIEEKGVKVPKSAKKLELVEELLTVFESDKALESAFYALTPGRQRGYNLHFSGAKQATTRIARITKYTSRILSGKGINDCVCGLTKRSPNCDGSHKVLKK